jgi:hypothetical protein
MHFGMDGVRTTATLGNGSVDGWMFTNGEHQGLVWYRCLRMGFDDEPNTHVL